MTFSKVGRRGQMVVPREVRDWLGIEEGDRVVFVRRGDDIVVQAVTRTLLDLRGAVPVAGEQDFDAIRETVKRARAERGADVGGRGD